MLEKSDKKLIESCIEKRAQITLQRDGNENDILTLIPVALSKTLLLARYIADFAVDGLKVIDTEGITLVHRGEVEQFHDEIREREGLLQDLPEVGGIDITRWETLIAHLCEKQYMLDIELELSYEDPCAFVGRATACGRDHLTLLEVDPLGGWAEQPVRIDYNEISMVGFLNRYAVLYDKYSQPFPKG